MLVKRRSGLALLVLVILVVGLPVFGQQEPAPAAPVQDSQTDASPKTPLPTHPESDTPGTPPATSQPDLTPDTNGKLSQEQMRKLVNIVTENYRANYKKERDYTYVERDEENKLDGNGQVKSTAAKTFEVMELYGEQVRRLIEKDDKPLSEKEAAKEEKRIEQLTTDRKSELPNERSERQAGEEKQRAKNREFVREVADAYNFQLVGTELLEGRDNWVIAGEPRPEFQAHLKDAEILSKFHGRLWIDKTEFQLTKMDVEALETVSFGWVLARLHKGTRLVFERTRVNDEVWLPQHLTYKLDARVALFKGYNERNEQTYRDYKKFRTSARIVSVGEEKP
jgi:hypothetical protein